MELLHQFGSEQREDLIAVVEERFARHVADTRDTLRGETHAGLDALRSELHTGLDAVRSEMHTGFVDVQKQFLEQKQQQIAKELLTGLRPAWPWQKLGAPDGSFSGASDRPAAGVAMAETGGA